MSVYVDDTKMEGRRESSPPMWARLQKKIELEEQTTLVNQVYFGRVQRAATVDEETIRTNTEIFSRKYNVKCGRTSKKR